MWDPKILSIQRQGPCPGWSLTKLENSEEKLGKNAEFRTDKKWSAFLLAVDISEAQNQQLSLP